MKEAEVQKLCRKMISEHKETLDMLVDYRHEMILHIHNFLMNMIRADDDLILDEPRVR